MAFYENVFIVRQDVSAGQVETLAAELSEIVKQQGGEVKKVEPWGVRNLPYRIRKNRKGHFVLLNVDGPPAAIAELERNQRLHEDVIRFLTVKVDKLEEGPSSILTNKGRDRDDRPGGGGGRREGGFGGRDGGGFRGGDRGPREGGPPRGDRGPRPAEGMEG